MSILPLVHFLGLSSIDTSSLPQNVPTDSSELQTVLGIVFGIAGALALLIIIISGVRYILSGGDPQKAAKAREGIIYALVGLVVAISAETIVVFVVGKVG